MQVKDRKFRGVCPSFRPFRSGEASPPWRVALDRGLGAAQGLPGNWRFVSMWFSPIHAIEKFPLGQQQLEQNVAQTGAPDWLNRQPP